MAAIADHWVAAVLFAVYTALLFYNANVGRRRSHDLTDYYVGGRGMGGVVVGISFFATFASTNSYIGHAGKGYEFGLPWLTLAAMILIFTLISWTSVAPRLRRFTLHWDAITLPDYLARRYGAENPALRVAAARAARVLADVAAVALDPRRAVAHGVFDGDGVGGDGVFDVDQRDRVVGDRIGARAPGLEVFVGHAPELRARGAHPHGVRAIAQLAAAPRARPQ